MKIRIDKNLTKEQLIERIPLLIKAATEAILEKSVSVRQDVDSSLWKSHSVAGVGDIEESVYEQGSDAISGIYSWLIRALKVETQFAKSVLGESTYRDQMLDVHGVKLGPAITFEQAKEIDEVLDAVPKEFIEEKLKTITTDARFGNSKRKYPNHGRYIDDEKKIILNPSIFGEMTIYKDSKGEKVSKITHTLLHEIGHGIDDKLGLSDKKEWRDISGWKYIGLDGEPAEGYERMLLREGDKISLKGQWAYKKDTNFPRWYGARNPKEDFCEAFVFAFIGAHNRFEGESGLAKLAFIQKVLTDIEKSEGACANLEKASDDEIVKSLSFHKYLEMRKSGMADYDDADVEAIAKSEFVSEVCDDLAFEKAYTTPEAKPAESKIAPAAVAKTYEMVGHKYLWQEELPDGKRYWYEAPSGEIYTATSPLHNERRHQPVIKTENEWSRYYEKIFMVEMRPFLDSAPGGLKTEHFDAVEVPKLIKDIKPHEDSFDPNAPKIPQKTKDDKSDWRHTRPDGDSARLILCKDDLEEIESVLNGGEIMDIEAEFGIGGVNPTFKVKVRDEGFAWMRPRAGLIRTGREKGVTIFNGIDEKSTVYREQLACVIDRILGWGLTTPTVVSDVQDVDQNHVIARLRSMFGENPTKIQSLIIDFFSDKRGRDSSLQFFVEDAMTVRGAIEREPAAISQIPPREMVRMVLFDMVINNRNRHLGNVLISRDMDPKNRYGMKMRLIATDNGHSFSSQIGAPSSFHGQFASKTLVIDADTTSDLKRLKKEIASRSTRKGMIPLTIMDHIQKPHFKEMVRRIDFILRAGDKIPDWTDFQALSSSDEDVRAALPYDVTGKTSLLDLAVKEFSSRKEIQDFLHPMLPCLNERQKEMLDIVVEAILKHEDVNKTVRALVDVLPKKIINQLFINQKFHERAGMYPQDEAELMDKIAALINSDLSGQTVKRIEDYDLETYNKLMRGEITDQNLHALFGQEIFEEVENRWMLSSFAHDGPEMSVIDTIFEDPSRLGWSDNRDKKSVDLVVTE